MAVDGLKDCWHPKKMRLQHQVVCLTFSIVCLTGCASTPRHGVVVSVSNEASAVGLDILNKGGNAVDAAVATAFALAVTDPEAGNIGGGGFMLIAGGKAVPTAIDYRETAPAAATAGMFAGAHGEALLVGVPGTVRGLAMAHAQFGRLPWNAVVQPAVSLAREGFKLDEHLARGLNRVLGSSPDNAELHRVFGKPTPWHAGDLLRQADLAATLQRIADQGPDAFYTGETAARLVAELRAAGGIMTLADLANYAAIARQPIHGTFRGYEVYSVPPPSSGGIVLVEMLNILENFDLKSAGRWSPRTLHLITEAMRRGYCDRASYLGDPDFNPPPPAKLASKRYAKELAAQIDPHRATPSAAVIGDRPAKLADEPSHTTHFSVIDRDGMAVSNTYTIEELFGSKILVRGAGFFLNNELGDFNPRPGFTDRKGTVGTPPNEVRPGKRPLSSMSPTILMRHGHVVLVTGSPGGRTIINTVLQVVLNVAEFRMTPREAVDAARIHHQWFPDELLVEGSLRRDHPEVVEALQKMGHDVKIAGKLGDAHTIGIDARTRQPLGAPDLRKNAGDQSWHQ